MRPTSFLRPLTVGAAVALLFVGAACTRAEAPIVPTPPASERVLPAPTSMVDTVPVPTPDPAPATTPTVAASVVVPLDEYLPTKKRFGQLVNDRFSGYHTGEDAEVPQVDGKSPTVHVRAAADGTVVVSRRASGYGGVIILQHEIDGETYRTLYGHVALGTATKKVGDAVKKGEIIADLGADKSWDTDGERQHLHFGVWRGKETLLAGYTGTKAGLSAWVDPQAFFVAHRAPTHP